MAPLLSSDDIDGLGADACVARDPRPHARKLVEAVDEGRLADPEDAGYALSLAAEAHEDVGDHDEALALSARAVTAATGTADSSWLQVGHAERLLRLGRADEGMAALTALRPLLLRDVNAVRSITEALTENGRGEIAEQWLTAAMLTAAEREERLVVGSDEHLDAGDLLDALVGFRRLVRAELGRAPDEYDALADELDAAPDLVFFPEPVFTRLLAARPEAADEFGHDWDTHRALVEGELQAADAEGEVLDVEIATPELLAGMTAGTDTPASVAEPGPRLAWPPGRNDPCWCGARAKYKKCCLPRGRDRVDAAPPSAEATVRPTSTPTPPTPTPGVSSVSSERVIDRRSRPRTRAR